ncbi:MAG: metallophosphoesterase, partial [Halobacteriales archaeon]
LSAVDRLACAGDVVGYNPWPRDCVEELRRSDIATVQGNHDRAVVTGNTRRLNPLATRGIEYAREALSDGQIGWLRSLPTELTVADGRVKLVHGHPDDPDRYTRQAEVTPDMLAGEDVLVVGHTHVQFTEQFESGIVLNPGSVGQPRDGDPRAAYSVLDLDAMAVEERRVAYDVERVQDEIDAAGLPAELGERLALGR